MKLAEVHTLYEQNASQIPAMLRQAADSIETEVAEGYDPTRAMVAVQIGEDGNVRVYGWGRTETMDSIALLHLGAAQLMKGLLADE